MEITNYQAAIVVLLVAVFLFLSFRSERGRRRRRRNSNRCCYCKGKFSSTSGSSTEHDEAVANVVGGPTEWGPRLWGELHRQAMLVIVGDDAKAQAARTAFLAQFVQDIACPTCQKEFKKLLKRLPPDVRSQQSFARWTVEAHNQVNQRLNKETIEYDVAVLFTTRNAQHAEMEAGRRHRPHVRSLRLESIHRRVGQMDAGPSDLPANKKMATHDHSSLRSAPSAPASSAAPAPAPAPAPASTKATADTASDRSSHAVPSTDSHVHSTDGRREHPIDGRRGHTADGRSVGVRHVPAGSDMLTLLPGYFTPDQIRTAYGFDKLAEFKGKGITIAVVDAFYHPAVEADLIVFSEAFKLPLPGDGWTFRYDTSLLGETPPVDTSAEAQAWAVEIDLDVQWIHAMAPEANIVLVAAKSPSHDDMMAAVRRARVIGAHVISMSWGSGPELHTDASTDFTASNSLFDADRHVFVASAGDSNGVFWPASAPSVIAVGGTQLTVDSDDQRMTEVWTGVDGGGSSVWNSIPDVQLDSALVPSAIKRIGQRSVPDVSMFAGIAYIFSTPPGLEGSWDGVVGTSIGAPVWAALTARLSQARIKTSRRSRAHPFSGTELLTALYDLWPETVPDRNGPMYNVAYQSNPGLSFDGQTGLGTPNAGCLYRALVLGESCVRQDPDQPKLRFLQTTMDSAQAQKQKKVDTRASARLAGQTSVQKVKKRQQT